MAGLGEDLIVTGEEPLRIVLPNEAAGYGLVQYVYAPGEKVPREVAEAAGLVKTEPVDAESGEGADTPRTAKKKAPKE